MAVNSQFAFSAVDAFFLGATPDGEGRVHTSYDFDRVIRGSEITIVLDFANVAGSAQDNIGTDNVAFGQVVPAPGAAALLVGAGLVSRRRR